METVKCPECKFTLNADLFKDGLVIKGVCPRCQTRLIYDPNKRSEFATREQVKPILSPKMKLPMGIAIGLVLGCAVLFLFRPLFSVGVAKENQDPWASFEEPTPTPRPTARPTPRPPAIKSRTEKIEDHFSSWDGSHIHLTAFVKSQLNDDRSFRHVDTTYSIGSDGYIVFMKYRASNAFGGTVQNGIKVEYNDDGTPRRVISTYP
jgi:uncharacterized protein YbaR (Trm112 family)